MKKRICSLLCAVMIVMSLPVVVCASDASAHASDYFSYTRVEAYAEGGGEILIEIDVDATGTMQKVGASKVYIYEQQSDGDYEVVYTFKKEDYPYFVKSNTYCAYLDVYYQGTSGVKYYALVGCYAKDSNGSETLYFETNTVTA